jgi:hypothetical protein
MSLKEKLKPKNSKFILTELKPNDKIYGINLKQRKIASYIWNKTKECFNLTENQFVSFYKTEFINLYENSLIKTIKL